MYNFIFWVLYKANINDGNFTAKFQATIIVLFALYIHLVFVWLIVQSLFVQMFTSFNLDYLKSKETQVVIIALSAFLIYKYYNANRIQRIVNKYSENESYDVLDKLKVGLLIFIPLISIILILGNQPK